MAAAEGIREVFDRVVFGAPDVGNRILVKQLRVCDAGALMKLVEITLPQEGNMWIIHNGGKVRRMAAAASSLQLLEATVLPALRPLPNHAPFLDAMELINNRMREDAASAGGTFRSRAAVLAARIDAFLITARGHAPFNPFSRLRRDIDYLEDAVRALLESTCTISHGEPAAGAAAGGAVQAGAGGHGLAAGAEGAQAMAAGGHAPHQIQILELLEAMVAGEDVPQQIQDEIEAMAAALMGHQVAEAEI